MITGASGFVGGHLVRTLATEGFNVVAVTGANPCPPPVAAMAIASQPLDLTDSVATAATLERFKPEVVIHCAALAQGAECERDPQRAFAINVGGTEHLLAAATTLASPPLTIYLSTDLVFDGNDAKEAPFGEHDRPEPHSVYAKSKRAAELRCLEASSPTLIARVSLVYGPPIAANRGALGWMISTLRKGAPLIVFTDEYRTPVYAGDIGTTLARAIRHYLSGRPLPRILHIPGPARCSRFEFGAALTSALHLPHRLLEPKKRDEIASVPKRPEDTSLRSETPELLALPFCGFAEGLARSVSE